MQPYYPLLKEIITAWDPELPFNCSSASSELNTILLDIQSVLRNFAPNCEEEAIPFLCSYLMPTCNNNGEVMHATVEECEHIRDGVCKTVWAFASTMRYGALLPNCSKLLNITAGSRSHAGSQAEQLTCHQLFVQTDCVCLPSCGKFKTRNEIEQALEDTAVFLAIITCFISTVIYMAFLVKRWKAM